MRTWGSAGPLGGRGRTGAALVDDGRDWLEHGLLVDLADGRAVGLVVLSRDGAPARGGDRALARREWPRSRGEVRPRRPETWGLGRYWRGSALTSSPTTTRRWE